MKAFHCFCHCFFHKLFPKNKIGGSKVGLQKPSNFLPTKNLKTNWRLEGRTSKTFQFSNFLKFLKSACIFKRSFVCERMELDSLRGGGLRGGVEIARPAWRSKPLKVTCTLNSQFEEHKNLLKIHADFKKFQNVENRKVFEVLPSSFQFSF